ncbi:MAG TPA: MaoC family dehydratase [Candidatus Lokiarchaeia archaeon]|nr:MaoC family dehydratase [Candidatus Lokiarchaeia archaeon]
MAKIIFDSIEALKEYIGQELGVSDWVLVTQEKINKFADATGDHQWIHVDVARAKKESPFGGPIAHGYLTLSLISALLFGLFEVKNTKLVINYGLNKVRFPAPVPVGKKVRARANVTEIKDIEGGVEVELAVTVEIEGGTKPACAAAVVFRYIPAEAAEE